ILLRFESSVVSLADVVEKRVAICALVGVHQIHRERHRFCVVQIYTPFRLKGFATHADKLSDGYQLPLINETFSSFADARAFKTTDREGAVSAGLHGLEVSAEAFPNPKMTLVASELRWPRGLKQQLMRGFVKQRRRGINRVFEVAVEIAARLD